MSEESTPDTPDTHNQANQPTPQIGRNEPCPCGSGRKYKRCHGVGAAPKVTAAKASGEGAASSPLGGMGTPGGFDPSQMDPAMMLQFTQALQRLPKGQLQRLQAIMQKAMSGRDVTQEARTFEETLPVEFQQMLRDFKMPGMDPAPLPTASSGDMTEEQARAIVEAAAAKGKISTDQADALLKSSVKPEEKKAGPLSRLWKKK